MKKDVYDLTELAETMNVSYETLRRQVKAGKLKAYKQVGKWFILHEDYIQYIKQGKSSITE